MHPAPHWHWLATGKAVKMATGIMAMKNKLRTILPILLASAALALSSYAAFDCNFVKFVRPPETGTSNKQAGLWNYRWWDRDVQRYTCHAYPENDNDAITIEVDGLWKAARGFSTLTLIIGGMAVGSVFATTCCKLSRCGSRQSSSGLRFFGISSSIGNVNNAIGSFYLICCLCSCLSLIFLRSNACQHNTIFNMLRDHECGLSSGAKCTYAAMALWFLAGSIALMDDEGTGGGGRVSSGNGAGDANDHGDDAREPLIQDVIFECEQSTYSGRDGDDA